MLEPARMRMLVAVLLPMAMAPFMMCHIISPHITLDIIDILKLYDFIVKRIGMKKITLNIADT